MEIVLQIALNAIIAGSIYTLVALGFNLIYSTARFFDIGYGAIAALGGYSVFYFYKELDLSLPVSIILALLFAGLVSFALEFFLYRKLKKRKASSVVMLVASLGVLTVLQAIIAITFSSQFQTLSKNIGNQKVYELWGGVITQTQIIILAVSILITVVLGIVLKYTLFGKAIRAVSDDEEVASIVGINSGRIVSYVFIIGGIIAAISGIAVGFDTGIEPIMGMALLLKGVIASIIGGIGRASGAIVGAFFLAIIENLGAWHFSGEWKDAIAFLVLIVFLIFRPEGILKR